MFFVKKTTFKMEIKSNVFENIDIMHQANIALISAQLLEDEKDPDALAEHVGHKVARKHSKANQTCCNIPLPEAYC